MAPLSTLLPSSAEASTSFGEILIFGGLLMKLCRSEGIHQKSPPSPLRLRFFPSAAPACGFVLLNLAEAVLQ